MGIQMKREELTKAFMMISKKNPLVPMVYTKCFRALSVTPCAAELFYFSSFAAGIGNAISSFKCRKTFIFMKK